MLYGIEAMKIDEKSASEFEFDIRDNVESETAWSSNAKKSSVPSLISQFELNDLVWDLVLPKDGS